MFTAIFISRHFFFLLVSAPVWQTNRRKVWRLVNEDELVFFYELAKKSVVKILKKKIFLLHFWILWNFFFYFRHYILWTSVFPELGEHAFLFDFNDDVGIHFYKWKSTMNLKVDQVRGRRLKVVTGTYTCRGRLRLTLWLSDKRSKLWYFWLKRE